ncbi:MAG: S1-like domain-containing RNA-binding protein [Verrucomicrobiota bacterium JB023]|nr:S1-like domain-containing RNA-binding protein [Verrucomicrobiota bacterium JB023]
MAEIGERASLRMVREAPPGVFLDAGDLLGEVLLPRRELPKTWQIGDEVDVFIYVDSEDRPVATLKSPKVMPGEFGYLEAVQTTAIGAFLDWGLPKDLLLPFAEQKEEVNVGQSYVVRVAFDVSTERLFASRRLARYLSEHRDELQEGEEVDLLIFGKTELGYKAIINHRFSGLLFANEVFRRLNAGEKTKGYVKKVREDGKVDLSLYAPGRDRIEELAGRIMQELASRGGSWSISDKSSPEEISKALGVSKKDFKKALGLLFKERRLVIEDEGIRAVV